MIICIITFINLSMSEKNMLHITKEQVWHILRDLMLPHKKKKKGQGRKKDKKIMVGKDANTSDTTITKSEVPGSVEPLPERAPADKQVAGDRPLAEGGLEEGRERGSSGRVRDESEPCILFCTEGIRGLEGRVGGLLLGGLTPGGLSLGRLVFSSACTSAAKGLMSGMMVPGGYSGMSKDDWPAKRKK